MSLVQLVTHTGRSEGGARNMHVAINGRRLSASDRLRILGLTFQTNVKFTGHIASKLHAARRAGFAVGRIISNRHIPTGTKVGVYKSYIRPIITYAAQVWCQQHLVSSHQMELMRRFERGQLRRAANVRRPRGSFRHVSCGEIYRRSGCPRIDRHIVGLHFRFYDSPKMRADKFHQITATATPGRFGQLDGLFRAQAGGYLLNNDKLMIWHRGSYRDIVVYPSGQ